MKIHQIFFKNQLRNFCYLIEFDDGAIYCIDPFHSTLVLDSLKNTFKGRHLAGIINTHDHCDHYSGNADLVARFQCPVMAHLNASPPHKTKNLVDREVIHQCNEWALLALDTPGHTMSHVCLLLEKNARPFAIFTGDCFFNAGVGNCHNGGDPEVLYETICNVFEKLSDDVLVYPGHEYLKRNLEFTQFYEPDNVAAKEFLEKISSVDLDDVFFVNSMKVERSVNTFIRLESRGLRENLNLKQVDSKKVFLTLRELRNRW